MAAAVMAVHSMPFPKFSAAAPAYPSPQIIEDRYIDDKKLLQVCRERFGIGGYKLKFKHNTWFLQAPCWLDEVTLELCEIDYS
ncbi:hypothetical protein E8E12_005624 [Didymella heteroderae]|uniref:Uncharacterized protein n=1 Tax=Didymella heteroderae TaxID=1769908 RepID=A0A9P4WJM7_9PLEO|nr:hypothetical protein E8E12_005624 [Didymella heteroderae]